MKSNVCIILFLMLGFVAKGFKDKDKGMDKNKTVFTFSGQVKDVNTGENIIGANITLADGRTFTSDFDGIFKFEAYNTTHISIKINALGYEMHDQNINALTLALPNISLKSLEP
jgi:hypothetical protein